MSVDVLERPGAPLCLGDDETCTTTEMLDMIASQYNTTAARYCEMMRLPEVWGGGPEIVALSNQLRLPVHVYELHTSPVLPRCFQLKESARFGSQMYDGNITKPVCILCADGR